MDFKCPNCDEVVKVDMEELKKAIEDNLIKKIIANWGDNNDN